MIDKGSTFLNPCGTGFWGPNTEEFEHKFSPKATSGEGIQWLRNLYFLYLVELRALQKAAPLLKQVEYYTGNDKEDEATRLAVHNFLGIIELAIFINLLIIFSISQLCLSNNAFIYFTENSPINLMSSLCFWVGNKHKN